MVGIDEVGRGSWAGPLLVVAARAIRELPVGLKDSKQLTRPEREAFCLLIKESCVIGEGWVQPIEIDGLGLSQAMRLGVSRALESLGCRVNEHIIIDGNINYCPDQFKLVQAVVKADQHYPIVSAASIAAKVARDTYMTDIARKFPAYKFEKHVGYGTRLHAALLQEHGPCQLHRRSYKPVRALLGAAP
ncbi:MAG: Ribonuclease [Candidatus Saccharibacteria bacterium]|nr:Ribonuclease [Candidatus Saccharibacteria bacterium]